MEVCISQCGCIPKLCRVRCGALPPAGGGGARGLGAGGTSGGERPSPAEPRSELQTLL